MKKVPTSGSEVLYDEKGKKSGIVIKVKNFEKLMEELEDLHDLNMIYKRKKEKSKSVPYEEVRKKLFGDDGKN